jgi:hypothetical protein
MSNHYADYIYLGCHRWARRDAVPAALLEKYDRLYTIGENNPGAVDPKTGRAAGGLWLDVVDQITKQVPSLLDRAALVDDQELRSRGNRRALDAMMSPRPKWP